MKFRRSGIDDPNALESSQNVQPLGFAKQSPWKRLDLLLDMIKREKPEVLSAYIDNLQQRYDSLVTSRIKHSIDISAQLEEFEHLRNYPELAASNLNYFFSILQQPENTDYESVTIEVTLRTQLRSVLCPKYQNLLSLTQTMARGEAIELYKKYHDEVMRGGRASNEDRYQDLDEFATRWDQEGAKKSPYIRIFSEAKDGKLYLRKDNCLWNDAISDLRDSELKYYICCYQDFESARLANRHFLLTMERTIIEGDTFCDSVFHDTRIDDNLNHPSEEFFANMTPED
jgi:hypothetical protein